MFKKIYVEITNNCNLNCSFCNKTIRDKTYMSIDNFKIILNKIKPYTKYIYLHLMGEPLMHPQINDLIDLASKDFYINLTTNGYLINRIENNPNIRQINISLHSFNPNILSLDKYLDNIFNSVKKLVNNNTIINYRLWVNSPYKENIIDKLNQEYQTNIENTSIKIKDNIFFDIDKEFIWPNLSNTYYDEKGTCKGTIDHIGILASGDVVPCCLDSNGIINLGNLYKDNLDFILKSDRYINIQKNFKNNKKYEELCKRCSFYQ